MGRNLHDRRHRSRLAMDLLMLGGLALGILVGAGTARGQGAVGFQPTIATFPDGLMLNATPVVSADRRYVRLGLQPQSATLLSFDVFTIPAAVRSGVGAGGFGGGGGFGAGGGVGGFSSIGPGQGPTMTDQGYQIPRFAPMNAPWPGVSGYGSGAAYGYGSGYGLGFQPAASKHVKRTRRSR